MSFKINGKISGIETIAQGSGIRCPGRLQRAYGIGSGKKKKGFATIVFEDGVSAHVEVHWYEAHGIGKMEMKIHYCSVISANKFNWLCICGSF
jgi:hypothetical protein